MGLFPGGGAARLRGDHQDRQPNFAYVDAVLKKRREQNLRTPQQLEENERQRAGLREVLASLGAASATVTEELLGLYAGWQAQGFDQEALVLAAGYLQRQGRGTPQELETLLVAWQAEGLTQGRQVREHLDRSKAQNQALQALFRTAGIRRSPTREDRAQLKAWQDRGAGWSCCCWRRSMRAMRTIPSP